MSIQNRIVAIVAACGLLPVIITLTMTSQLARSHGVATVTSRQLAERSEQLNRLMMGFSGALKLQVDGFSLVPKETCSPSAGFQSPTSIDGLPVKLITPSAAGHRSSGFGRDDQFTMQLEATHDSWLGQIAGTRV